jgi:hypothetical protein
MRLTTPLAARASALARFAPCIATARSSAALHLLRRIGDCDVSALNTLTTVGTSHGLRVRRAGQARHRRTESRFVISVQASLADALRNRKKRAARSLLPRRKKHVARAMSLCDYATSPRLLTNAAQKLAKTFSDGKTFTLKDIESHHRVNLPNSVIGQPLSPVRLIFWSVADVEERFARNSDPPDRSV